MMNTQEALKMAIEVMQRYLKETPLGNQPHMIAHKAEEAIHECKEALAQQAQEPVGEYMQPIKPLVTTPSITISNTTSHPAPAWQGLSDDEIIDMYFQASISPQPHQSIINFIRAIEQALKEKNAL